MTTKLAVTSVKVLDQEEALDFYVNKLGMEVGQDIKQGPFRWLTVRFPANPEVEIFLEEPGPPVHDEATAAQLRELIAKGAMGSLVIHTDVAKVDRRLPWLDVRVQQPARPTWRPDDELHLTNG